MLHGFCLFFLSQRGVSKQPKSNEEEGNRWMAENEQLKKTGRFRVRFERMKKIRENSSESSSSMTYNGEVLHRNNMNMYNIINN